MSFAPSPVATDGEAANPGPRMRRRGPRSESSRRQRLGRHVLQICREDQPDTPDEPVTVMHVNIRGFLTHIAETTAMIRNLPKKPCLVVLNETFLTKAVEDVQIEGYVLLARRDRGEQWGGGVAVFVQAGQVANASVVEVSDVAERIWTVLHTDQGPYLICSWYRPPAPGHVESIVSLEEELNRHKQHVRGSMIIGDANVHSARWLHFSNGETPEGRALECVPQGKSATDNEIADPRRAPLGHRHDGYPESERIPASCSRRP